MIAKRLPREIGEAPDPATRRKRIRPALVATILVILFVLTLAWAACSAAFGLRSERVTHEATRTQLSQALKDLGAANEIVQELRRRDDHRKNLVIRRQCPGPTSSAKAMTELLKCVLSERYMLRKPVSEDARLESDLGLSEPDLIDLVDILEAKLDINLRFNSKTEAYRDAKVAAGAKFLTQMVAAAEAGRRKRDVARLHRKLAGQDVMPVKTSDDARTLIVFFAGSDGSGVSAGRRRTDVFGAEQWPRMVARDGTFADADVVVVTLDHSGLRDAARALDTIVDRALARDPKERVIFVAHESGSLDVRAFLVNYGRFYPLVQFSLIAVATAWQPLEAAYGSGARFAFLGCVVSDGDTTAKARPTSNAGFCNDTVSLKRDSLQLGRPLGEQYEPHLHFRRWYTTSIPPPGSVPIAAAQSRRGEFGAVDFKRASISSPTRWGLAQTFRSLHNGWLDSIQVELSTQIPSSAVELVVMDLGPWVNRYVPPDESRIVARSSTMIAATGPLPAHTLVTAFRPNRIRLTQDRQYAIALYGPGKSGQGVQWYQSDHTEYQSDDAERARTAQDVYRDGLAFEKLADNETWQPLGNRSPWALQKLERAIPFLDSFQGEDFAFRVTVTADGPRGPCADYQRSRPDDVICLNAERGFYWQRVRKVSSWGRWGVRWQRRLKCDAEAAREGMIGYSGSWIEARGREWNEVVAVACPNAPNGDPAQSTCPAMPPSGSWDATRPVIQGPCVDDLKCGIVEFACKAIPKT